MNKAKRFIIDFLGFFFILASSALIFIFEVLTQIIFTLEKLFYNVIKPALVEGFADFHFFLLVMQQGIFDFTSNVCLKLSRWLLSISEYTHRRSEELINRCW